MQWYPTTIYVCLIKEPVYWNLDSLYIVHGKELSRGQPPTHIH